MHSLSPLTSLLPAILLALRATALVLPRDDCSDVLEYQDLAQSAPFDIGPINAVAVTCDAPCSHSREVSHTEKVEITFEQTISAGLDLEEIFSLGVEAKFTETWSTSDSTTSGTTVDCTGTGYTCGAIVTTTMVTITGSARVPPGGLGCAGDNDFHPFTIQAPVTVPDAGGPDGKASRMNFAACVVSCEDGSEASVCAAANNLDVCPPE
ncbi:hypothetical protein BDV96DRAFT_662210 [Lophiotrema nucula]|uniref:Phosphatidylglycerol/phosphatidylinositol transfer protein n=1 Tax=Lophiotrema nucula TaxID=690887 RepID=A0A6A5Z158_9PLEO|nr:hypothetical protein BDV96DRAFT_662210 [Lophiotrema nucula]